MRKEKTLAKLVLSLVSREGEDESALTGTPTNTPLRVNTRLRRIALFLSVLRLFGL